jgi:hypothetical protein
LQREIQDRRLSQDNLSRDKATVQNVWEKASEKTGKVGELHMEVRLSWRRE